MYIDPFCQAASERKAAKQRLPTVFPGFDTIALDGLIDDRPARFEQLLTRSGSISFRFFEFDICRAAGVKTAHQESPASALWL
jgi:hypothetical protein